MKKIGKILKVLLICFLLLVLLINILIIIQSKTNPDKVPGVFGYKPFIVLSGSMESQIHVGDLVLVKEVDVNTLKVNDIIVYKFQQNQVIHIL